MHQYRVLGYGSIFFTAKKCARLAVKFLEEAGLLLEINFNSKIITG